MPCRWSRLRARPVIRTYCAQHDEDVTAVEPPTAKWLPGCQYVPYKHPASGAERLAPVERRAQAQSDNVCPTVVAVVWAESRGGGRPQTANSAIHCSMRLPGSRSSHTPPQLRAGRCSPRPCCKPQLTTISSIHPDVPAPRRQPHAGSGRQGDDAVLIDKPGPTTTHGAWPRQDFHPSILKCCTS